MILFDGQFPEPWGVWTPERPVDHPEAIQFSEDYPELAGYGELTGRFELRPGWLYSDGKNRAEVRNITYIGEGQERYIGWSFYLPADFPNGTAQQWHIIAQLKQRGVGSPPISLEISGTGDGTGNFRVKHNLAPSFDYWSVGAKSVRGRRFDVVLRVKFSKDPAVGFLEFWLNGVQRVLSGGALRKYAATMDPNGEPSYPKIGYYRDQSCPTPGVVFHSGYRMGESYDEVSA